MGSTKALSLATIVVLGTVASAAAADLLPPPPIPAPIPAPLDTSGWYIRADVGAGVDDSYSFRSTLQPTNPLGGNAPAFSRVFSSVGDFGIIGFGVGYQFNNWFRGDVTGEYRFSSGYKTGNTYTAFCPSAFCLDSYNGNFSSAVFLANGYVDLGTWYGVTPFIGAGVGVARHKLASLTDAGNGFGFAQDSVNTNFAWALHAGVGYSVTQNLKLEFSYRYLNSGTFKSNPILCGDLSSCFFEQQSFKVASHDFRVGMRWMIGGGETYAPAPAYYAPPPPPPPGPLVRKY